MTEKSATRSERRAEDFLHGFRHRALVGITTKWEIQAGGAASNDQGGACFLHRRTDDDLLQLASASNHDFDRKVGFSSRQKLASAVKGNANRNLPDVFISFKRKWHTRHGATKSKIDLTKSESTDLVRPPRSRDPMTPSRVPCVGALEDSTERQALPG